jgi:hypothetical protein
MRGGARRQAPQASAATSRRRSGATPIAAHTALQKSVSMPMHRLTVCLRVKILKMPTRLSAISQAMLNDRIQYCPRATGTLIADHCTAKAEAPSSMTARHEAKGDQAAPRALLRGIRKCLAKDGVYVAQDIKASRHVHLNKDHPFGTLIYTIACMHCMPVSLARGGEDLGAMWGRETAERYMREAGFRSVVVHELPHDPMNYDHVCRP